MTAAASARTIGCLRAARMGIMAGDAPAWAFGMIGVDVRMATLAGELGSGLHVVRRVAAGTAVVGGDTSSAEHRLVGVAGSALDGSLRLKSVRLVTAKALAVATREQRRRRHDWFVLGMAIDAGRACRQRRSVLVLMAGRTSLRRCLAATGVRGRDAFVTIAARRAVGRSIVVWSMAAEAVLSAVYGNGWHVALRDRVTAFAVLRLERRQERRLGATAVSAAAASHRPRCACGELGGVTGALDGESVAARAVGLRTSAQARRGLPTGVRDTCLLLVAGGAAPWRYLADRSASELVAFAARDTLLEHVRAMPNHGAIPLPGLLHGDPLLGAPSAVSTGGQDREQNEAEQPYDRGGAALGAHDSMLVAINEAGTSCGACRAGPPRF